MVGKGEKIGKNEGIWQKMAQKMNSQISVLNTPFVFRYNF